MLVPIELFSIAWQISRIDMVAANRNHAARECQSRGGDAPRGRGTGEPRSHAKRLLPAGRRLELLAVGILGSDRDVSRRGDPQAERRTVPAGEIPMPDLTLLLRFEAADRIAEVQDSALERDIDVCERLAGHVFDADERSRSSGNLDERVALAGRADGAACGAARTGG